MNTSQRMTSESPESSCTTKRVHDSPRNASLPVDVRERIENHPCYSDRGHQHFARMHVAVAPACNIQCHYCNRKYDCSNESRPGVVSEVLTPEQAVRKAVAVGAAIPQLAVLGIAWPGDALADPERTFATFELLAQQAPDLKLCISTNGLALPDHVDTLLGYNIEHVTITINCLDPAIGTQIYPWVFWQNRRLRGRAAVEILIERQLTGLAMLAARGILVKVNSVLIPGVNDQHLPEVARAVRARGAFLPTLMPLISDPAHGTYFGLTGQRAPTPEELAATLEACGSELKVMRHCQQCRADAVGRLGEDRSAEFSMDNVMTMQVDAVAAQARRAAYRQEVASIAAQATACRSSAERQVITLHRPPRPPARASRLVAVATRTGERVDEHFGYARRFHVYRTDGVSVALVETRDVEKYCQGSDHCAEGEDGQGRVGESRIERIITALRGCDAVLCARIGLEPWQALERAGIEPSTDHALDPVGAAVLAFASARAVSDVSTPARIRDTVRRA